MSCVAILVIIVFYTIGNLVYGFVTQTKRSKQILSDFNELYESDNAELILLASPTCQWCKKFVPILDEIVKENNLKYYYLNVTEIFDNDFNKIQEKIKINAKGIPHLIAIKDKKVIGEQGGAESKENTIEFLTDLGIIKGELEDGQSISASS